jgi:hypothetical protein
MLKSVIVGKIAKFIKWENDDGNDFIITIYKSRRSKMFFEKVYKNRKIQDRRVQIKLAQTVDEIGKSHILYIPNIGNREVDEVLRSTASKNILTVGDSKGFAERGGVIQLYFASRKIKFKINYETSKEQRVKISSTLLRISKVIKG